MALNGLIYQHNQSFGRKHAFNVWELLKITEITEKNVIELRMLNIITNPRGRKTFEKNTVNFN